MKPDPFHLVLTRLLAERDMTRNALARRVEGLSGTAVYQAASGELVPGVAGMEAIARGLEVKPEVFAEWRLESRRDALDWRKHGLASALQALDRMSK